VMEEIGASVVTPGPGEPEAEGLARAAERS
jgi:hypothetical protein